MVSRTAVAVHASKCELIDLHTAILASIGI